MQYQKHELTSEVLAEIYGGTQGFAGVWVDGTLIGTYSTLRKKYLDGVTKINDKKAASANMFTRLKTEFPELEVFVNKSQPNIFTKEAKFYIITGPKNTHQMSITHNFLTYKEMSDQLKYDGKPGSHNKHILISGIDFSDITKIVKTFLIVEQ